MNELLELVKARLGAVRVSSGKNGSELVTRCPFCGRQNKFYINPTLGIYVCQRCRESGRINVLLESNIKFDFVPPPPKPLPDSCEFPGEIKQLSELPSEHPALIYLQQRKFDPVELQSKFGVCFCSRGRTFARMFNTSHTIILPIWMYGRPMGWQARLLYNPDKLSPEECAMLGMARDDDGDYIRPPKYWTSPGLEKGRILYNYDVARQNEVVVITEGPFDAIAVGSCGVATLGKSVSSNQLDLVQTGWKCAVVLLDPDAAAESATLSNKLKQSMPTVHVILRGYKDAGDAPRMDIWTQIVQNARAQNVDIQKYRITM